MPLNRDWQAPRCGAFLLPDQRVQWRVWAPKAKAVTLELFATEGPRSRPMQREDDGYFALALEGIDEAQRYGYRLDNGPLRPDPCSRWQPGGAHQPSAVALPERFVWTDQSFQPIAREDLVFYELHVGTFTEAGTFDAIIPRLPELKALGITALELMPIAEFPGGRNWGYDGVQLYAPQHTYGGPHGLARLVDAAHAQGLAVFLDVVYNHFGPEGNYVGEYGPYYSERYRTAWGPAFNFDGYGSDAVRQFVLDNVAQWIGDYHLDGLRLDAVHSMYDISPQHILSDVKQVADEAAADRSGEACIVVESLLNDVRMLLPREQGGYQLDGEWNEDFHHALLAYLTGERHGKYVDFGPIEHLPRVLNETFLLSGGYSRYRGRKWGRPVRGLSGDRFVIGIQNHDHVGNRAVGERLGALVSASVQRLAASVMLLSPHVPLLFMGEEYGEDNPFLFFCSFGDPGLIENVRQGRRRDYTLMGEVPDPQAESSFHASKLSWSWPPGSARAGLRQLYQDLLVARKVWPALRDFTHRHARLLKEEGATHVLELIRGDQQQAGAQTLAVYFNLCDLPQAFTPPENKTLLFSSAADCYCGARVEAPPVKQQLAPYECVVYGPADCRAFGRR
jgi:maltooligosyltrehalose trehalohydrolase